MGVNLSLFMSQTKTELSIGWKVTLFALTLLSVSLAWHLYINNYKIETYDNIVNNYGTDKLNELFDKLAQTMTENGALKERIATLESQMNVLKLEEVTVSGKVPDRQGIFTLTPIEIAFKLSDGTERKARVVGNYFSLSLKNHNTYEVLVYFDGLGGGWQTVKKSYDINSNLPELTGVIIS